MLLIFQNCSPNSQARVVASIEKPAVVQTLEESEPVFQVEKNLKIK